MALPFRRQIFVWLVVIALIPASVAAGLWFFSPQIMEPAGGLDAWERAADSWRVTRRGLKVESLPPSMRAAVLRHDSELSYSLKMAHRAHALRNALAAPLGGLAIALIVLVAVGALRLAGHLSRQLSRPVGELVDWTERIARGEPLPDTPPPKGAPEFQALRERFRAMAGELDRAREREVESARLRTFREMARSIAHELKNPLTPIRFAIQRLDPVVPPTHRELLGILDSESARLEQMARDFTELGRLPDGPTAPVDIGELLETIAKAAPPGVAARVEREAGAPMARGHYEPLRRAFQNLFLNACDAIEETAKQDKQENQAGQEHAAAAAVVMSVRAVPNGAMKAVEVTIADTGAGMAPDVAARIFEPYFTTKAKGTGLGLALVRQTVHDHAGTITVASTPGAGTTFTIRLPAMDLPVAGLGA